ncbi:hypothetical protein PC129_g18286 [Phytophthora cactorum]|uniref:Uncharacterized protein n=1 Tax=Phytophthora cactorum TaxID=29920 RepID=A0A329S866_9STRA|nr:hypothetical protein Pcac1_g11247 [Phytophthora cactorum]KAG2802413.1 hypothetical protein PC112_g19640 [Phytophthora cactorum]KAG2803355.1 hypothetical protein PC111_g18725 [Phytophthora cactorum]KAG2839438.1 hypothetical protein PC113_g19476 [Phytophthora cactorum]KAG2892068.1 hypothetical protein PC115_g18996 [Phytophthora cactorum]
MAPSKGEDAEDEKDAVHWKTSNWEQRILAALHAYKELKA